MFLLNVLSVCVYSLCILMCLLFFFQIFKIHVKYSLIFFLPQLYDRALLFAVLCTYMYGCMFIFCLRILSCNSLYEFIINVLNFYSNRAEYPDLSLPEGQQKGKLKISRPSSNVL